jgi:capsular polysaccharide biosynthesis protein
MWAGAGKTRAIDLNKWRREIALIEDGSIILDRPIGVFVDLACEDLAEEVAGYLAHVELPKRIYVSINSGAKRRGIAEVFRRSGLDSVTEFSIEPNDRHDVAPMLVQLARTSSDYDVCVKIQAKKSIPERIEFGGRWRELRYRDLIGDAERVKQIVRTMIKEPNLGILLPPHYYGISAFCNVDQNFALTRRILARVGIDVPSGQKIEFPTSSMFWFRNEALAALRGLRLDRSDFDADSGQDGALGRAIEGCLPFFCANAGKQWGFLPPFRTGSTLSRNEVVRLIRASGAFDEAFYKAAYPDVGDAGLDPVEHWVDYGSREGRDPSDPRHPNEKAYRLLELHLRGEPLTAGESIQSSQPERSSKPPDRAHTARAEMVASRSWDYSPLEPSDPSTHYNELAPAVSSVPAPPRFVLGPFPRFLTHSYFADVTALPVGCYTLNKVGVTSHGLLVRDGALLTSDQLSLSVGSVTEAARYGSIHVRNEFSRLLDDLIVSLAGPGHLIYGHWLIDFLPKLYLLTLLGIDPFMVKYLLPANTPRFAITWLHTLGITERQLVFFEPYAEIVGVTRLVVPTLLRTSGRTHPLFRSAIDYLLSLIPQEGRRAHAGRDRPRLYLSRGVPGPEGRKLLNRQAIEQIAVDAGYAVIRPETLSITDQLAIFARAKCIVGEYGSALHGCIFAPPETVVCALRASARHPGFLQSGVCEAMGQRIGYVFGSAGEFDVAQEFTIPEDDFKTALALLELCLAD